MESGDRVAMLGENSHRSIELYYGPCWGGGVFVPLNPRLSEAEILAQLRDAEPMALILDPALAGRAGKFLTEVPSLKAVISVAIRRRREPSPMRRSSPAAIRRRMRCAAGRIWRRCSIPAAPPAAPRA